MKLQRKGTRHSHRGVIGVESAIVMIAFVIVAAALAFVVLNMGFTTTQKAKTSIISSLDEASSSMQIAGKVIGSGDTTVGKLNMTAFPIKIASGGANVNLDAKTAAVKYVSNSIDYDNIYVGTLSGEYKSLSSATAAAVSATSTGFETFSDVDVNPFLGVSHPSNTRAFIYWSQESTSNDILEQGETAVLAIAFKANERPSALDKVKAEIIVPTGAALTVERQVPTITNQVVDLG
ncbi:archaellin/type IV pilin N-terminal domain-containing protein [Nitrosopumilus ureiphilus]|uniref:Flagellin n=1 Tax=Nitrosopumilus ureiphilus TaxID=1470067 RepID=A0A7D5M5G0_9ARCH|nr:archaellin/type IV pilin N-terminal domain-containing protein [Nitrosopumilus ureiphilus]QLH06875.1 flagellin [Nitrosopumilus ureiphilus]